MNKLFLSALTGVSLFSFAAFAMDPAGDFEPLKTDSAKYYKVHRKAAAGGNIDSQIYLARHCDPKTNFPDTLKYFTMAADQGDEYSQSHIGHLWNFFGNNPEKSFEAYKRYADKGNVLCQIQVSEWLQKGKGTPIDLKEAFKYALMAATEENVCAIGMVGEFNFQGQDVDAETMKTCDLYYGKYLKIAHDFFQHNPSRLKELEESFKEYKAYMREAYGEKTNAS